MAFITPEEVQHVARLARLELTPEELELFRGQLSAVLERAQRIQALDLDDVPPTAHPMDLSNVWRDDSVERFEETSAILDNAPEAEESRFRVPRILEASE
jgi:aspartyl-tRNA(Asn)/glutamyl-tRNA(Gln) amidotransferase subunit C